MELVQALCMNLLSVESCHKNKQWYSSIMMNIKIWQVLYAIPCFIHAH